MFSPTIDKFKQQEIEDRIERLSHPVKKWQEKTENVRPDLSLSDTEKKPKKKKKYMFKVVENEKAELKAHREPKFLDYLGERRKVREESDKTGSKGSKEFEVDLEGELRDLEINKDFKNIKKKADFFEKEAHKKEALLNTGKSSDFKNLKKAESVDKLYIGSIKAKLAVLENSEV